MSAHDEEDLDRELKREQLKFYKRENEERDRQQREREFELWSARQWGYPVSPPRRGRR